MADTARKPRMKDLRRQPFFTEIAWACIFVLYAPILVLIIFSFNDNRSVVLWTEFSFRWYVEAFENEGIRKATIVSFQVAAVSTFFATIMATMATTPHHDHRAPPRPPRSPR